LEEGRIEWYSCSEKGTLFYNEVVVVDIVFEVAPVGFHWVLGHPTPLPQLYLYIIITMLLLLIIVLSLQNHFSFNHTITIPIPFVDMVVRATLGKAKGLVCGECICLCHPLHQSWSHGRGQQWQGCCPRNRKEGEGKMKKEG